jgi:hypothetical protein
MRHAESVPILHQEDLRRDFPRSMYDGSYLRARVRPYELSEFKFLKHLYRFEVSVFGELDPTITINPEIQVRDCIVNVGTLTALTNPALSPL